MMMQLAWQENTAWRGGTCEYRALGLVLTACMQDQRQSVLDALNAVLLHDAVCMEMQQRSRLSSAMTDDNGIDQCHGAGQSKKCPGSLKRLLCGNETVNAATGACAGSPVHASGHSALAQKLSFRSSRNLAPANYIPASSR